MLFVESIEELTLSRVKDESLKEVREKGRIYSLTMLTPTISPQHVPASQNWLCLVPPDISVT